VKVNRAQQAIGTIRIFRQRGRRRPVAVYRLQRLRADRRRVRRDRFRRKLDDMGATVRRKGNPRIAAGVLEPRCIWADGRIRPDARVLLGAASGAYHERHDDGEVTWARCAELPEGHEEHESLQLSRSRAVESSGQDGNPTPARAGDE
jgi:hypothetical protein